MEHNNYAKHLVILIKFLLVYLFLSEVHRLELKYHLFHLGHLSLFQKDYRPGARRAITPTVVAIVNIFSNL